MEDNNLYAAPDSDVLANPEVQVWSEGKTLVFSKSLNELPERCIKCNSPTNGYSKKVKLSYLNPWFYLTILISILVTIICHVIFAKRHQINVGLCERHRRKRKINVLIIVGLLFISTLLFTLSMAKANAEISTPAIIFSMLGYLVALIWGLSTRLVYAKKITNEEVWLGGVSKEFLAGLLSYTKAN